SVLVQCEGTSVVGEERLAQAVRDLFPLKPREIISHLKLQRPIYRETAHDGHFGRVRKEFTWEKTDKAAALRKAVKA
ncbi:MAG TPA: methionine adenosyltransferase domain-containing protein, partial [Phycisphaerae bacterium]|nr:methionine adenosyltransferase domain-containing protein [Phycisphaerae bacterium]